MGFEITNEPIADKMHEGMIISYNVRPILGIKLNWVTEITQVEEGSFFIDDQRAGPYKLWHHQHRLSETENGVLMEDIVSYLPPLGPIGKIMNALFIRKEIEKIFGFRTYAIEEIFGKTASPK